jgi:alpha-L-rhamnosidase
LRPIKVVSTTGNVSNAEALVADGQGYTSLTMVQGGTAPMIILDYGHDVGGLPVFEVTSVSGTPKLQAIYSESQQNLLPAGDGAPAFPNAPGDPSRVDTYSVIGPAWILNRLVQGGERFEAITLAAPGTVTLRLVGIRARFFQPENTSDRGSFHSNDPALNDIWSLGAYTLSLDQVPPESMPPLWTVTGQGLDVKYSPIALYQGGGGWTDYTASFEAQVISNEASWVVRDGGLFGYVVALDANNDALNTPNMLRVFTFGLFGSAPVVSVHLPFALKPGTWHAITTVAAGSKISVSVDGQPIISFAVPVTGFPSAATGSFGFQNALGAEGLFSNLSVVSSGGQTLYASALTDRTALDVFAAGTNTLPAIVDGAKRDRLTFAGDLSLAAPTVYYSNGASQYVAGSLERFGSFRRSSGEVASVLSPLLKPGVVVSDNLAAPNGGFFSVSYSTHFVNDLFEYYLYTGDRAFISQEWPAVESQLAYLAALTNAQHLVVTDASNGDNWILAGLTGTVTEYNDLYYRALTGAVELATALGKGNIAANLQAQAALVKDAINSTLFDVSTGVYDISDSNRGVFAQDANAEAVLFGVAPASQAASILQKTDTALNTAHGPLAFSSTSGLSQLISPFASGFDVHAHFEAGDATGALNLIRTVWGPMRPGQPYYSGATWEALALNGMPQSIGTSLAHAWSSGPTSALSKYVLGVRPVEPGYKTWLVEPQPGDLSWATGTVPTPFGPIAVGWEKDAQGFNLELLVPAGTSGTVGVPVDAADALLSDNGRTVTGISASKQPNGRSGYVYLQDLKPGAHVIQVTEGKK